MREHGYLGSAAGSVPFGHLGWGYRDRAEFLRHAAAYIADGLRQNQRIAYVGEASGEALRAELTVMSRIDERLDWGDVEITPATEYYQFRPGDVIDAEPAVARCVAAAEQAIDDGYRGLRTVVDVTPMARTPEQRDALARLEYLVDQEMAARPYASLCGYDTGQLSTAAAELVCLHPFVGKGSVPFRIYADPDADVHFALTGEIDAASNDLFTTTLQRIWPLMTRSHPAHRCEQSGVHRSSTAVHAGGICARTKPKSGALHQPTDRCTPRRSAESQQCAGRGASRVSHRGRRGRATAARTAATRRTTREPTCHRTGQGHADAEFRPRRPRRLRPAVVLIAGHQHQTQGCRRSDSRRADRARTGRFPPSHPGRADRTSGPPARSSVA